MEGGKWVYKQNPAREEIEASNVLSMFRVSTRNFDGRLPFYPLPFRNEKDGIMFPPNVVSGRYMRNDVIGALKYFDRFNSDRTLWNYGRYGAAPELVVSEALFFIPGDPAGRPLGFVRDLFDLRAKIVKANKNDMQGKVIKLGINSVYGKTAQSVGRPGELPPFVNFWYAAAITAGTRRQALEAALTDPAAIICFATDAIFSTRKLPIHVPETKMLGEWEFEEGVEGAFAQSGVYTIRERKLEAGGKPKLKTASRGFKPNEKTMGSAEEFADALDRELFVDIPEAWRKGRETFDFDDTSFIGLGAALASPKTFKYLCHWKNAPRTLNLNDMSAKRRIPASAKKRAARAERLINLEVRPYTFNPALGLGRSGKLLTESKPSIPDWMLSADDPKRSRLRAHEPGDDDDNIGAKFDDGSDPMF